MLAATLAYTVGAAAAEPHGAALPGAVGWNGTLHGGLPMPNYAPAYLASGLFGVRVPPGALARPGSCTNCSRELWNFFAPTVSTMVGGYVYVEDTRQAPSADPDGQHDRQIGASPAPYPFETEVLVTTPGGVVASLQASIQGNDMNGDPSEVTPLSQSLDMATGELTTELRFGAKDGSWWVALTALQFISQSVPSLALQTLTITSRHPTTLPVVMRPRITPTGLPGTPYTSTTPSDIFNEGTPNMLLAMRSNSGAEVAMCAATQCSSGAHNIPMREPPLLSLLSELHSSQDGSGVVADRSGGRDAAAGGRAVQQHQRREHDDQLHRRRQRRLSPGPRGRSPPLRTLRCVPRLRPPAHGEPEGLGAEMAESNRAEGTESVPSHAHHLTCLHPSLADTQLWCRRAAGGPDRDRRCCVLPALIRAHVVAQRPLHRRLLLR